MYKLTPGRGFSRLALLLGLSLQLVSATGCGDDDESADTGQDDGVDSGDDDGGSDADATADTADASEDVEVEEIPYSTLSQYGLFDGGVASLVPAEGVVPYFMSNPLFSEGSAKFRFIRLPEGGLITFDEDDRWVFPVDTILVKVFGYYDDFRDPGLGIRLLETRLLILTEDGWTQHAYIYNDEQTEAERFVAGATIPVAWIDADGEERNLDYRVPNNNQCIRCHAVDQVTMTLGPHTRQLNRTIEVDSEAVNQIDYLADLGMFDNAPPPSDDLQRFAALDDETETAEARARGYLDANCGHCHNSQGAAQSTAVFYDWVQTEAGVLGVCRPPFSAGGGTGGHSFDIVPGEPDESILVFRMESEDPEFRMPVFSTVPDDAAIAVIRQWITEMDEPGCDIE